MNKTEVITTVSEKSGVSKEDCEKVLNTFEAVLEERLSESKSIESAFNKIYKMMSLINNRREK
jgi:nucleoid DNA-binding protein